MAKKATVSRIICIARTADADQRTVPELRMIDPRDSATNHKYVPTPIEDAGYLISWLREYLPRETWNAFRSEMQSQEP